MMKGGGGTSSANSQGGQTDYSGMTTKGAGMKRSTSTPSIQDATRPGSQGSSISSNNQRKEPSKVQPQSAMANMNSQQQKKPDVKLSSSLSQGGNSGAPKSAMANLKSSSPQKVASNGSPSKVVTINAPAKAGNNSSLGTQNKGKEVNGILKNGGGTARPLSAQPSPSQGIQKPNAKVNNLMSEIRSVKTGSSDSQQSRDNDSLMGTQRPLIKSIHLSEINAENMDIESQSENALPNVEGGETGQQIGEVQPEGENPEEPEISGQGADSVVVFSNEKELRDHFSIQHKIESVAGVLIKVKKINDMAMENVLFAIEQATNIINLRFEDTVITRNASQHLANFLKGSTRLEMLGFVQVKFEDINDHKKILESISKTQKMKTLHLQQNIYVDVTLSDYFKNIIQQTKSLRELDFSWSDFRNQNIFYVIMQCLKKSMVYIVKLRGIQIHKVEGKIMQEFIMDSKTVQTLDIQHSYGNTENFEFLRKFDSLCHIKHFNADSLECDVTEQMPFFGRALGSNTRLETLTMRECKSKGPGLIEFWRGIKPNRQIRSINFERSKCGDKVVIAVSEYLQEEGIMLSDLNLNRNGISGKGIIQLALGIGKNRSLRKLWLTRNEIEDDGLEFLAASLTQNKSLEELYLSENQINNTGLIKLSSFLQSNSTLKILDLSKNAIGSPGLVQFSAMLETNAGIIHLNLSKNRDINDDETGIKRLAASLQFNSFIKVLDLTGIRLQKIILKQNFLPSLQQNVFIHKIIGKYSQGVLNEELNDNETIEKEIVGCLGKDTEYSRTLQLSMKNKKTELLRPALKLIRCQNLEIVDFTSMTLTDDQMKVISSFIGENPALKRLILTQNIFITDYGMILLIEALRKNTTLQHLSIMGCSGITNIALETLHDLVRDQNMTLFKLDIESDSDRIDKNLAMEVMKEAYLNKSIQRELKPQVCVMTKDMYRIDFDSDAILIDNFDSVLKCWRIMRPNHISVTNQNLEDEHIEKLSTLFMDHLQNHMLELSLRINNIGDKGAEALAKFIQRNEKQFTYMEISRNKISPIGGRLILEAMKQNTRISQLLVEFGNELGLHISKLLENEVKANQNIGAMVKTALVPDGTSFGHLDIKDKGPQFLRCCLKAVSELYIINLQLSDNIIGYIEVRKICKVLKNNAPLRVLNLSHNKLDYKCAIEISNALTTNSHLLELDVSYNQIKDEGIAIIILPLAKQRLRAINNVNSIKRNTNIRIGKLVLTSNCHTHEALKHVYALLFADKDIVVDIDLPQQLQAQKTMGSKNQINPAKTSVGGMYLSTGSPLKISPKKSMINENKQKQNPMGLGRFARIVGFETQSPIRNAPAAALQDKAKDLLAGTMIVSLKKNLMKKVVIEGLGDTSMNKDESLIKPQFGDQEAGNSGGPDDLFLLAKDETNEYEKMNVLRKSTFTVKKFCCGVTSDGNTDNFIKNFIQDLRANEKDARLFKCNENVLSNVESVSQRYITIFLYVSAFFFYFTALIIPLTQGDSCSSGSKSNVFFYYFIYIVISSVFELVFTVYLQKMVGEKDILRVNKFHLTKIITGQLARMDYFTDVLFLTSLYWCEYTIMLVVGLVIFTFSYAYLKIMPIYLLKKDENQMIESIERNCKLAYVTEHQALAVILDSFSLTNYQTFRGRTITIPKIICSIKSFVEDLPQFGMQIIYILFYSSKKDNETSVVLSILMGLMSFSLSIKSALHATSSALDVPKVESKIRTRIEEKHAEYLERSHKEQEDQLNEFRAKIKGELELIERMKANKVNKGFTAKLTLCEGKRSFFMNGVPNSVDGSLQQSLAGPSTSGGSRNRPITSYFKQIPANTSTLTPTMDLDSSSAMSLLLANKQSSPGKMRFGVMNQQQKTISVLGLMGQSQTISPSKKRL